MLSFHQTLNLTREQIAVTGVPSTRKVIPQVEAVIEQTWHEALQRPNTRLFDGPMCRLESCKSTDRDFSLVLSTTGYKAFFGTNMSHPDFADIFGTDVMANPLGVSSALQSSDGFLVLGQRNSTVAYYPNRIHPFAGSMEPPDADPFVTARRELSEELSLEETDISEIRMIGLAEDHKLRQPEAIFSVASNLTRAEIEGRIDRTEHHGCWSVVAGANEIEAAIAAGERLTPIAIATLALWGRVNFGDSWFEKIVRDRIQTRGNKR